MILFLYMGVAKWDRILPESGYILNQMGYEQRNSKQQAIEQTEFGCLRQKHVKGRAIGGMKPLNEW